MLRLAICLFKFRGNLKASRFDDENFPDDEVEDGGNPVMDHKLAILNREANYIFHCTPLNTLLYALNDFHNEHNEKIKEARISQTQEAYDTLSQYEADVEANLHTLLAHFDNVLQDPAADWSLNAVDFAFPTPATMTGLQKGAFEKRKKFLLSCEWNKDSKSAVEHQPPQSTRGKGRNPPGQKCATNRRVKLNVIPEEIEHHERVTRSSTSRQQGTK